jgi:enoyl-CoA hydratase
MTADDEVLCSTDGGVAWVTLNRPAKLNALNATLRRRFDDLFAELAADDAVKVVVLSGAGRAFSAGADLTEVHERELMRRRREIRRDPANVVREFQKPVIAMIHGYAVGGGLEIAASCDIRLAAAGARLGYPEITHGWLPAGGGGTQTLPRLVGLGQAMILVLTGRLVDAPTALRIGLVDEVHDDDELRAAAERLAGEIAKHRLAALVLAKAGLRMAQDAPLPVGLRYEQELSAIAYTLQGKEEAVAAFQERREPRFAD